MPMTSSSPRMIPGRGGPVIPRVLELPADMTGEVAAVVTAVVVVVEEEEGVEERDVVKQ